MSINSINSINSMTYSQPVEPVSTAAKTDSTDTAAEKGVVYEKTASTETDYQTKNAELIQKLKQDSEDRISQLKDIVTKMITKQGQTIGKTDDIWSFLASGNFSVDEAARKKAQEEISENGYWGVEQTSERILDFAKALSGGDSSKADELLDAFKKGFKEATKTWGKDLPDISQKTYDAVVEKFDKWKNGEEQAAQQATQTAEANTQ